MALAVPGGGSAPAAHHLVQLKPGQSLLDNGKVLDSISLVSDTTTYVSKKCDIDEVDPFGHWQGYVKVNVPWRINTAYTPDMAWVNNAYNPPGDIGAGISIQNATNYIITVDYLVYTSAAGMAGQYQDEPEMNGGGHVTYIPGTAAMWYVHPPYYGLPWANAPRIEAHFFATNAQNFFTRKACVNYVPDIPA